MKRAVFLLALAASGCGSYSKDLYKLCNAHTLSGAGPDGGIAAVAVWLDENLDTKKSRELLVRVANQGNLEELRAEAAAHGVTPCPLVDPDPAPATAPVPAAPE